VWPHEWGCFRWSWVSGIQEFPSTWSGRDICESVAIGVGILIIHKCQWYTSILGALALIPNTWSQTLIQNINFVLVTSFATYIYRDVWPLATFTDLPLDVIGPLLYAKMSLLTVTAVLIPLFVPRRYIPVDLDVGELLSWGHITENTTSIPWKCLILNKRRLSTL